MKRSKKRRINYFRVAIAVVILILIIWGITKACGAIINNIAKNKEENNNSVVENVASENNENNENSADKATEEKKPERESKAIPLAEGEKSKNSLAVLMYHYFFDSSKGETGKNSNYMDISKFEDQLKYLKESDYYYPTWQEVSDFVDGKIDLPEKSVVITIDDGQKSLFNLAIPLLDKYDIPATGFVITSKFNTDHLETYKNSTINFESHSDNMHRAGGNIGHGGIFTALSLEDGVADLKTSIEKLGGNSGALAYPYGDYTDKTKQATKEAGFKVAFTTEYGKVKPGMDKYKLPRVRMSGDISLTGFKNSI